MKIIAFVFGLCISIIGAVGILVPSGTVWLARLFLTSGPFYVIAAIRIAFSLILISVASSSRFPKVIRILGYIIFIAGVAAAFSGLVAIEQARGAIEWWLQQGSGLLRLTCALVIAFGAFIAYACAPAQRTD